MPQLVTGQRVPGSKNTLLYVDHNADSAAGRAGRQAPAEELAENARVAQAFFRREPATWFDVFGETSRW